MIDAKKWLSSIQDLDEAIQKKQEEVDRLRQMAISTAQELSADRVQTSLSGDKFGNCICKAADLSKEIDRDVDRLCDLKRSVIQTIGYLNDEDEIQVLCDRFIEYRTVDECAQRIGKSERHTHRILTDGIRNIQTILNKGIQDIDNVMVK